MRRAHLVVHRVVACVPCTLTPSLSRVHPGAVHRMSFCGRGGTRAAGPRRRGTNLKICPGRVRPVGCAVHTLRFTKRWRVALVPSPLPLPRPPGCCSPGVVLRERGNARGGAATSWDKFENLSGARESGGMRRAHPTVARVPCTLTPSLSRVHPGAVHRMSFCGRGGTRAAEPRASRRSDSPTDARSVGSAWPRGSRFYTGRFHQPADAGPFAWTRRGRDVVGQI